MTGPSFAKHIYIQLWTNSAVRDGPSQIAENLIDHVVWYWIYSHFSHTVGIKNGGRARKIRDGPKKMCVGNNPINHSVAPSIRHTTVIIPFSNCDMFGVNRP
jgi:hypothetical protein